jgi:N-acetyl-alpha-D-glucosaminyl L-malate synthase BshA
MKIGVVCYPTFGGSGVVATELGIGLAQKGHEVHFITYKRPERLGHFQENIFFHEVSIRDYPLFEFSLYDTALTSKLVDVIKHENLDILHVHYAVPHASVAFLAQQILIKKGKKIPIITTLHGTDITLVGSDRSIAPVVEFGINASTVVTAVSESLKSQTLETFDISNEINVIPNFIDFDRFRKIDKEHFKKALAPNGERILIHISNFRKVKRADDVIHIFKNVREKIPSTLLMIGDGPERNDLEELCRSLNLCDEIRFLGKQYAVEELLAISDLFLLPSQSESFGLAALEAMACEVPVISSNAGGIPEVNVHGETGFMCNVGDIEGMSKYAEMLLKDDALLSTFRKKAFENASKFDLKYILPLYEEIYEEALKKVSVVS